MNTYKEVEVKNLEVVDQQCGINLHYSSITDEELWKSINTSRGGLCASFIMIGSMLYELRRRYAVNKTGNFQKICKDKGFKKTEVQTLISKYLIYNELSEKESYISRVTTDINEIQKIFNRIENGSQETIRMLKKLPAKDKERFLSGELSAYGVKIIAEELKSKKEPKKTLPFYKSLNNFRKKILKINPSEVPQILDEIKDVEKFILEIQKELQAKIEK